MDATEGAEKPTARPLDAERTRLRKEGYTDHEISQILIARAATPQATEGAGQGVMTGALSNLSAVLSHARAFIPSFKADLTNLFDRAASPPLRVLAAVYLVLKVAMIAVLAYAVKQEWQQHIISQTEIAANNAAITKTQIDKTAEETKKAALDAKKAAYELNLAISASPGTHDPSEYVGPYSSEKKKKRLPEKYEPRPGGE